MNVKHFPVHATSLLPNRICRCTGEAWRSIHRSMAPCIHITSLHIHCSMYHTIIGSFEKESKVVLVAFIVVIARMT